jgi:hypothetical protein
VHTAGGLYEETAYSCNMQQWTELRLRYRANGTNRVRVHFYRGDGAGIVARDSLVIRPVTPCSRSDPTHRTSSLKRVTIEGLDAGPHSSALSVRLRSSSAGERQTAGICNLSTANDHG